MPNPNGTPTLREQMVQEMRDYADLLEANGFTIHVPNREGIQHWFQFSREVDGQTCYGSVTNDPIYRDHVFSMPIKPSHEHGSGMWVEGVTDEYTLENARKVASPSNYNRLVGTHQNYREDYGMPITSPREPNKAVPQ